MSRWQPDTGERLSKAALELFQERGFDTVTVSEIALHAGLTERTFFRYFTDKREVLFGGRQVLESTFKDSICSSTAATPLQMVTEALYSVGELMEPRRPFSRQRQAIIMSNHDLQERELLKMEFLSGIIATALKEKNVPETTANLTADMAITVFKNAFAQWVNPYDPLTLRDHMDAILRQFKSIVG